jgi:hypothetical protein
MATLVPFTRLPDLLAFIAFTALDRFREKGKLTGAVKVKASDWSV